jgi:hypothetical protein
MTKARLTGRCYRLVDQDGVVLEEVNCRSRSLIEGI